MRNNFSLNLPSKIPVCSCAMCQGNLNIKLPKAAPSYSGDYQIDALNSGYRWQNPATLTYSFFTNGSSYYGSEVVSEVNATIKSSVRTILEQIIEPLINVNFVEVADSSSSYGKLRFMFSNGPGYAYGYYPYSEADPLAGDVHLSPNYEGDSYNAFSSGPGNHGFATLIHEIGHALGLKHTGDYYSGQEPGPYLPYAEDNTINSVMSYNFPWQAPGNLMPYDVKTLQYLYGAKAKNLGDTTYTFNNVYRYTTGAETNGNISDGVKIAIVDSGGIDTLNFSQLPFNSSGYRFDISENGLITDSSAYNARTYTPYNNSTAGTFFVSTYGTRISFTSLENLINSSSNDYIIAGNAANTFSGYSPSTSTGNDTIEGANNLDILNLSSFNSNSVTQTQSGNDLILGLATNRTINIKNYYSTPLAERLQIQFAPIVTQPTISLNDVSITEGNTGSTNANFVVSLNSSSTQAVTVQLATANGTASAGSDYNAIAATVLTFNPGETRKTFSVAVLGDTLVEPNETFFVNLATPTNATIADNQGIGTIINDDTTTVVPRINIIDTSVVEGQTGTTKANFTVTLNSPSAQAVTVNYNTVNGTAQAGSDYTGTTATVTFNPSQTITTISVAVTGDSVTEPNERFFVNLASSTNSTITNGFAIGTILNDDNPPRISISDRTVTEGNTGITTANFTVSLSNISATAVTVNYSTSNVTAAAGSDYQAITLTTLTFNPGETTKTISVQVNGDTTNEPNERFLVNLATPVNGTLLDSLGIGTITNDDNPPRISISDRTVTEGNSGITNANFTVSLSNTNSSAVTVNYSTSNFSATAGSDYVAISTTTLTFNPGETTKTISVQVNGDSVSESNERFFVNLGTPVNGTLLDSVGIGTITNDDNPPRISISDRTVTEGNTGITTANFAVSLSNSSSTAVTINFSTGNGNAQSPSDYTATTGVLTFNPGETSKTISVAVNGDTIIETNERFLVNLTSVSGGTFSDNLGVGTIIDNDAPASKPQSQSLLGRVKTLTGSAVSDVFTLENNTVSVIKGFEPNKDLIKLSGKESDFTTKTGNFGSGLPTGVGIFGKGELIALVTDVTPQSLTSNSFDYLV